MSPPKQTRQRLLKRLPTAAPVPMLQEDQPPTEDVSKTTMTKKRPEQTKNTTMSEPSATLTTPQHWYKESKTEPPYHSAASFVNKLGKARTGISVIIVDPVALLRHCLHVSARPSPATTSPSRLTPAEYYLRWSREP
jgi:hypothetical protein